MLRLSKNIFFLQGAKNGAIYDLNNNKVYSINSIACRIIKKLSNSTKDFNKVEENFIDNLRKQNLISENTVIEEIDMGRSDREYIPEMVWLEITQGCNLRCVHCYEGNTHIPSKKVLSLEQWKDIIYQISSMNLKRVVVIGGEPCVHKNLIEILEELVKYNINTTLFTNATLLVGELRNCIIKNKISVKVSFYGPDAETHDGVTKIKGSFNKTIENVRYLVDHGVTVNAAVIAMRENQDKIHEMQDFLEGIGIKYTRFDVIRNVFGGTQDEHTPTNREIIEHAKFKKPVFKVTKEKFLNAKCYNSCWFGKMAITETGDVIPCVFERNISYGNVKDNTLQEILAGEQLKKYWNFSFENVDECKDCEYRYACKDCRPLGISVKGDIHSKNPRCRYNPYLGIWGE